MRNFKRFLILIFLSVLFTDIGLAFEPELIFELPIAGKTTFGSILDGNLIVSSPEGFRVLTPDGKESYRTNLQPTQGLVASQNGKFFGIITYSEAASPDFLTAESFDFYYANGNKLLKIENPEVSDFRISNQANLLVGVSGGEGTRKSRLVVYNDTARVIKSLEIGFLEGISFSKNGKYVFVNSGKDGLLAFDEAGNLKANFGLCENFTISSDGEYVATIFSDSLKFYHKGKPTGNALNVNPLIREMSFSPENKYLTIIDKKNLFVFEVQTRKLLWQYSLDKPELSFVSVDISGNAEKIITGIDFDKGRKVAPEERHTTGLIYLFDKEGKITWEKDLSYKLWSASFPQVQFSSDGTRFSVITREKIYLFREE